MPSFVSYDRWKRIQHTLAELSRLDCTGTDEPVVVVCCAVIVREMAPGWAFTPKQQSERPLCVVSWGIAPVGEMAPGCLDQGR